MSKIHLVKLEVRELFRRPFNLALDGLSPEVSIVYGPNASGKSSLTVAACRIFNQANSHETDRILATLNIDGVMFDTQLRGKILEGAVPQSSRGDLYKLAIPDLIIGPDAQDTTEIRNALSGGIDLVKLLDRFSARPPVIKIADLEKKRLEASLISKQEEKLVGLYKEKNRLHAQSKDLAALTKMLEAAVLESGVTILRQLREELCSQYPGIERQSLNAVQDLSESLKNYKASVEAVRSAQSRLQSYRGARPSRDFDALDKEAFARHRRNLLLIGPQIVTAQQALDDAISEREKLVHSLPSIGISKRNLEPDESQLLSELIGQLEEIQLAVKEQLVRVQESGRNLSNAVNSFEEIAGELEDLPTVTVGDGDIQLLIELDSGISQGRNELQRLSTQLKVALDALGVAEAQLPGLTVPTNDLYGELSKQPTVASLADQVRKAKTLSDAFQKAAEKLRESQQSTYSGDETESAVRGLSDWIKAIPGPETVPNQSSLRWIATGSGIIVLLLGFAISIPAGSIVGALALFVLAILLSRKKSNLPKDERPIIQNRIPTTWRPLDWSVTAVVNSLESALNEGAKRQALFQIIKQVEAQSDSIDVTSLESALTDRLHVIKSQTGIIIEDPYELAGMIGRLSQIYDARAYLVKVQLEKESVENDLESKLKQLKDVIEQIGAPVVSGASAREWITRLRKCRTARADLDSLELKLQGLKNDEKESARRLIEFFESYEWPSIGDLHAARNGFLNWQQTSDEIATSDKDLLGKKAMLGKLQESSADIESCIRKIFANYSFPVDIDPVDGLNVFEQWFEISGALDVAERVQQERLESLRAKLAANGIPEGSEIESRCNQASVRAEDRQRIESISEEITEKIIGAKAQRAGIDDELLSRYGLSKSSDVARIRIVVDEVETDTKNAEAVQDEINEITSKILAAETSTDLAGAQSALDKSIDQAVEWIHKKAQSSANEKVRHAIDRAVRAENTPQVVANCNLWLSRLTQNRYGHLEVTDSDLTVVDLDDANRRKLVSELSTGTKAHLGLAVRLGVIEASETQGVKFPLFLDEVMATSDPEGSLAIAGALKEISKDRQIVVMTNQPDDLSVLRSALGQDAMVLSLYKTGPIPIVAPERVPEPPQKAPLEGLPLHTPVLRWPTNILKPLLTRLDLARATVGEAVAELGNIEYNEMLVAIEEIRQTVKEFYPTLSWENIAGLELGGNVMQQKVRAAFDESSGNPETFWRMVDAIPNRRTAMVESLKEGLSDLGFFQAPPDHDSVVAVAYSALPESFASRMLVAQGLATLFRDYTVP